MTQPSVKRIFLKVTISQRLKCPICYEVFDKPRRLFCGHTFCKACLLQMLKPHKNPQHVSTCPLCRVPIDRSSIGKDLLAEKIINQLQVMCPVNGCPWRGQSQLLDTHYRFECRLSNYLRNVPQQKKKSSMFITCAPEDRDPQTTEKINENVQKGSLLSRVLSKNPSLLDLTESENQDEPVYWRKQYQIEVKHMVSRSTQTKSRDYLSIEKNKHRMNQRRNVKVSKPSKVHIKLRNGNGRHIQEEAFNDSESNYQQECKPQINVINLEDRHQRIHINRSRPKIFRM